MTFGCVLLTPTLLLATRALSPFFSTEMWNEGFAQRVLLSRSYFDVVFLRGSICCDYLQVFGSCFT